MCSHKLLPHGTNVNTSKQKMRFSCAAASPAGEWAQKQPQAIIKPEFLHMKGFGKKNAHGRHADDTA